MDYDTKLKLYRAGQYAMPAPPAFTGNWGECEWVRFIDWHGQWLPKAPDLGPTTRVPRVGLRT